MVKVKTSENKLKYSSLILLFLNTLHREGKIDVLKELCQENKINYYVVKALKAQDKFGQTPMLSAINAPENR